MTDHLVIAGLGYSGTAVALAARACGMEVTATAREVAGKSAPAGVRLIPFAALGEALPGASHLLVTAAPTEAGDPVLAAHGAALDRATGLRWVGYCSTTGVYGDRQGGEVDETTAPAPGNERTRRRVVAEAAWAGRAGRHAVDILRLAGIYGPGRSVLDDLRAGTARRIDKPDHKFSRIHVEDIAHGALAAMKTATGGTRILNFSDDEPAPSATVIAYAAGLLGIEPPALVPFETARRGMSAMAASFWSENRVVRSEATKAALGVGWRYPTYREGVAGVLAAEGRAG